VKYSERIVGDLKELKIKVLLVSVMIQIPFLTGNIFLVLSYTIHRIQFENAEFLISHSMTFSYDVLEGKHYCKTKITAWIHKSIVGNLKELNQSLTSFHNFTDLLIGRKDFASIVESNILGLILKLQVSHVTWFGFI